MRVRRGLLFWGLFLIPLGALPLLVRAGSLDPQRLVDAWRLWPVILVGVGLAILLRRSRTAVVGTAIIALVLGTIGGAALASGNLWLSALSNCGVPGGPTDQHLERTGTFADGAAVGLDLTCGSLTVGPVAGTDWNLRAAYRGPAPLVDAAPSRLDVRVPDGSGERRQDWTLGLPVAGVKGLDVTANAASATFDLAGMHLAALNATMNAGDLRIDAGTGAIDEIDVTVNAGRIRLTTGSTAVGGHLSVNAGAIDLCVPEGVGLRLRVTDQLTFVNNLGTRGLARSGTVWTRDGSSGAALIDLSVDGSAASFTLNPDGGCR
jgi:hypothetical protein